MKQRSELKIVVNIFKNETQETVQILWHQNSPVMSFNHLIYIDFLFD